MTLDEYQRRASSTAIYMGRDTDDAFDYLIPGLCAEVGELAGLYAKVKRGDGEMDSVKAITELGDILWFVAMIGEELGWSFSCVAMKNVVKLCDRKKRGVLSGSGDER